MKEKGSLNRSIVDTISYEYISGLSKCLFEPHRTEWRMFPYTVIVCVFDSDYICEIFEEDTYTVKAGEVLVVPAGLQHRMFFENQGFLNCLHIKYTVFNTRDILSFFEVPRIIRGTGDLQISDMVDDFVKGMIDCSFSFNNSIRIKCLALSLLNEILDRSKETNNIEQMILKINTLLPVLDYIRKNLSTSISRKTLADIMSLSETRFHYVFKSIMNVSPMKYVRTERLQKAHIMISTTQRAIYEISTSLGYSDYSNFTKQFKDYFGETPSEVRENIRTNFK